MSPLEDLMGQLIKAVNTLNEKIDGKTEVTPKQRRGRPKGSKNKIKEPVIEDEDEIEDDDEDEFVEDKFARSGSIQRGKRRNEFDGTEYSVPINVIEEDKKAMELFESGKLKRAKKREPAKMAKVRCAGCGKTFKDFKTNIKLQTGENGYRCNRCAGVGA